MLKVFPQTVGDLVIPRAIGAFFNWIQTKDWRWSAILISLAIHIYLSIWVVREWLYLSRVFYRVELLAYPVLDSANAEFRLMLNPLVVCILLIIPALILTIGNTFARVITPQLMNNIRLVYLVGIGFAWISIVGCLYPFDTGFVFVPRITKYLVPAFTLVGIVTAVASQFGNNHWKSKHRLVHWLMAFGPLYSIVIILYALGRGTVWNVVDVIQ